jgi:hypothetical protein
MYVLWNRVMCTFFTMAYVSADQRVKLVTYIFLKKYISRSYVHLKIKRGYGYQPYCSLNEMAHTQTPYFVVA